MVDTSIYSGVLGIGMVIDSFGYAEHNDTLAEINAFLVNDWAVTNGAVDFRIHPRGTALLKPGGRGLRTCHLTPVHTGDTITRSLPGSKHLRQTDSQARYLTIRAALAQGYTGWTVRPILINQNNDYCAGNNPKTLTNDMKIFTWKIGSAAAGDTDFDYDLDEQGNSEPGSVGTHVDYDDWDATEYIKKVALRFDKDGTSMSMFLDEILIFDIDADRGVRFNYDAYNLSGTFEYLITQPSGGHGEHRRARRLGPAMFTISGLLIEDQEHIHSTLHKLRQVLSQLDALTLEGYKEWVPFLQLDDEVFPVDIIDFGLEYLRESYKTPSLSMTFVENNNSVVLD